MFTKNLYQTVIGEISQALTLILCVYTNYSIIAVSIHCFLLFCNQRDNQIQQGSTVVIY